MGGAAAAAALPKENLDTLSWALKEGAGTLFGPQFDSVMASARAEMLATALSPALWRPVLSYLLFCTLLTWWVLGELGLMYWRVFTAEMEGKAEEEEEEAEAAAAASAAGKAATASAAAEKESAAASAVAAKEAAAAAAAALAASEDVD